MKNTIASLIMAFIFSIGFGQIKSGTPEVSPITIQKKFSNWADYQKQHIRLSADFIPLNTKSVQVSKAVFLKTLLTGTCIPIRLNTEKGLTYKLFKINPKADTSIKATITQIAFDEYEHFKMEGKPFPDFNFVDLNGQPITNATMKGKIVVIKCWYIHCTACIQEFPYVNALAEKYKNRNDIQFVSLAEDTPEQLNAFLTKKPLAYAVVPNMKIYMNQVLNLNAFPTHFILNKEGMIVKVLSDYESLNAALSQLLKE
ncbi:TlpA family protein disulfide reductase [Flavobacterium sp. XGLA_31]|uniref:TlpA family protein disulfide reductase n=1 Tax=Flavobacterium sp. XGLA_31 TaxID=3447666 RepID=UPI003F403C1F